MHTQGTLAADANAGGLTHLYKVQETRAAAPHVDEQCPVPPPPAAERRKHQRQRRQQQQQQDDLCHLDGLEPRRRVGGAQAPGAARTAPHGSASHAHEEPEYRGAAVLDLPREVPLNQTAECRRIIGRRNIFPASVARLVASTRRSVNRARRASSTPSPSASLKAWQCRPGDGGGVHCQ